MTHSFPTRRSSERIVIYRGEDGAVRAMSAYCKHMGADLSVGGEVVGNNIRCPFHHWAYGDGGQCRHIPAGDEIPKRATLFHFASRSEEHTSELQSLMRSSYAVF